MGGGEGEGRPGRRGGGARGRGTRGEEGAGSQSGSIRFSHHPRRGSQQLGRREERQRSGYSASRRLSARRGPQAPGSRPPRRHDAQEEGEQWPRPAHAHSAARPSPEPREAQARRFLCSAGPGRLPNLRRAGGLAHGGLRAAFWNVRQLEEPGARFERGGGNPLTSRGRALFSRSDRPGARGHFCSRAVPTRPLLSPAGQLRRGGGEGGGKNTLRSRGWARFAPHRAFLAHFRFFSQSPRGGRRGCQLNRLLQKWKRSQKRRRERINLQTKKCKQKGKEEQRENRRKWPTRRLKKTYLQKMERLKTRRAQPLMKQKRKKPSLINNHIPSPVSGPCFPSCTIQRNIFINYFVNASFLVALETFLKRRESHLIPFFKCKCFFLRGEIICWLFIFWYNQKIVGYWIREALIVLGVSLTFHRWGVAFISCNTKAY
uniref:Uncharacterized protein n=1 Tax=Bos indicus x Bos taurus TaxID=30522 RepID=A0A4W2DFK4_BOBOX